MNYTTVIKPRPWQTILLFAGVLLLSTPSIGQSFNEGFGFGLNVGYAKRSHLNHLIDRYNETRPWLDKEMSNIRMLYGYHIDVVSVSGDENLFEIKMGYHRQGRRVKSIGTDVTGEEMVRQIKYVEHTFSVYFGGIITVIDNFGIGVGSNIELGGPSIKMRTASRNDYKDEEYEYTAGGGSLGLTPKFKIVYLEKGGGYFYIEGYNRRGGIYSIEPLDKALNSSTFRDHWYSNFESSGIFGINIGIVAYI